MTRRGKRRAMVGVVMVCGCAAVQCASPGPRDAHRSPGVIPVRMTASPAPPKTANRTPRLTPKTTAPASGCSALLERYQHETARIPYPANLPIRAMLGVGVQLVRRYDRLPARDRECRALLRMTLDRFFVRRVGPGVAPTPLRPVAATNP